VVAGEARGNMIGVIAIEQDKTGICDAQIDVAGSTAMSTWHRTTHAGEHGVFLVEIPRGSAEPADAELDSTGKTSGESHPDLTGLGFWNSTPSGLRILMLSLSSSAVPPNAIGLRI
jgi:hypothetical protein